MCTVQGYDFQTYFTGKWRGGNVKYFEYITMALTGPLQELYSIVSEYSDTRVILYYSISGIEGKLTI